jgi:hypothetical protein
LTHGEDDDRDPAWSPDGKTVAFASDRDGSYDIWAVDVASGATRQITKVCARTAPPHGARMAGPSHFPVRQARRVASLRPATGGEATALRNAPSGAHYDAPSYGPKGELAYVALDNAGSHLEIDGKPVSGKENVFPFHVGWQGAAAITSPTA